MVEVGEFETADPKVGGEMTLSYTVSDAEGGGTGVVAVYDVLPPGVSVADNEPGWRVSPRRLAAWLGPSGNWPWTDPRTTLD